MTKRALLVMDDGAVKMVPVDSIQDMYRAIECTAFDRMSTRYPIGIYFDDEFLLKVHGGVAQRDLHVNAVGTLLGAMLTDPDFPIIYGNMLFIQESGEDSVDMEQSIKRGLVGAIRYIEMTAAVGKESVS